MACFDFQEGTLGEFSYLKRHSLGCFIYQDEGTSACLLAPKKAASGMFWLLKGHLRVCFSPQEDTSVSVPPPSPVLTTATD